MRWGEEGEFYGLRRWRTTPRADGTRARADWLAPSACAATPILGYRRMHAGLDFEARHGTPIVAVTDGTVKVRGTQAVVAMPCACVMMAGSTPAIAT